MKATQSTEKNHSIHKQQNTIQSQSFRSMSTNLTSSGTSFSQITQSFTYLKCIQKNDAVLMCCSEHCDKSSSLCGQRKCHCNDQHKKCLRKFYLQHWEQFFQAKNEKKKLLIQQIQQIFDSLIDELSRIKQTTISSVDNVFLNEVDILFLQKLRKQELSDIQGKNLFGCSFTYQLQNNIQFQKRNLGIMIETIQKLNQTIKTQIKQFQTNLISRELFTKKDLSLSKLKIEDIQSSILTSKQELQKLQNFLPSRIIKYLSLLYRASDNNFSTRKFWETCQNIPNTLVIIKTQTHKIIGGYTPVQWKKYSTNLQLDDPSGESFIFSLSLNQKFELKNKEEAIYFFNQDSGPRFGKLCQADIGISNKCNEKKQSYVFQGNAYQNQKYKEKCQLYEKFVGEKNGYFKIIEWEVFQIIF